MKGRKQYAFKNIIYNFTNKILTLALSFLLRTVFIWGFGVEYLGINGLFNDVLQLLSMADLGFGIAMVYSFYDPLAKGDKKKITALICFYRKVYIIIALAVTIIGLLIIPVLPKLINLDHSIPHLTLYYLIALGNVVVSYLFVYKTSILTADQKNYIITRITLIITVIKTSLQIITIIVFKNYVVFLSIGILFNLVNNIWSSFVASKEYPFITEKENLNRYEIKQILGNVLSVFTFKVSNVLMNATDNILISTIIGTVTVGYYSNYTMIQNNIIMFYTMIFTSITASIGNIIFTENKRKLSKVFNIGQSIGFIMGGIIVPCYIVLVNDFIGVCWGVQYEFDIATVLAIGFNMYLSCVLQPLWTFREATGLYRKTKWIMVVCAIVNVCLSYILGFYIGVAGIIFASGVSRIITYIWYEPMLLFKSYFNEKVGKYYWELIKNFCFVLFILIVSFSLSQNIYVTGFFSWLVEAIIVFLICITLSGFIYHKSEGVKFLLDLLKSVITNVKRITLNG